MNAALSLEHTAELNVNHKLWGPALSCFPQRLGRSSSGLACITCSCSLTLNKHVCNLVSWDNLCHFMLLYNSMYQNSSMPLFSLIPHRMLPHSPIQKKC